MRFLIKGTGHDAFQSQSALQNLLQIGSECFPPLGLCWKLNLQKKKKKNDCNGLLVKF